MPIHVIRSDPYLEDLLGAWDYAVHRSLEHADQVVGQIEAVVDQLSSFPDIGESCPQQSPSCRRVIAGKFLVYYERYANRVVVLRVIHGSRRDADPNDLPFPTQ